MMPSYTTQRRSLLAACDWNRYVYRRGLNSQDGYRRLKEVQLALATLRGTAQGQQGQRGNAREVAYV